MEQWLPNCGSHCHQLALRTPWPISLTATPKRNDCEPIAELFAEAVSQAATAAGAQPFAKSVSRARERTVLRQPMSSRSR